jgi:hypothetical protein
MHFRGWRINYELAAYGIADRLDLTMSLWSGPRARFGQPVAPARPAHREPGGQRGDDAQRDAPGTRGTEPAVRTIPLSTCGNT